MNHALSLRLDKVRWWALREQPFYGQLTMGLPDTSDPTIPLAATNGRRIMWNESCAAKCSEEELRWVMLHETLHCAHLHMWRLNPKHLAAQVACDYVINRTLKTIPGCKEPKGVLQCPKEFMQLAEEEIYRKLVEEGGEQNGDAKRGGVQTVEIAIFLEAEGKGGECEGDGDADGNGGAAAGNGVGRSLKDDWTRRVIQAIQAARMHGRGTVPAWADELLERVLPPRIDWRQEMAEFVKDCVYARNDWSRSARRHSWQKVIYPRRQRDETGLVVFARDCSGSIDNETCAAFTALITNCIGETKCRGLVLDHDTAIAKESWIEPGEECPLIRPAFGGTSHVEIGRRVTELAEGGERVAGVIALTDMDTEFPDDPNGTAWLWLATQKKEAPFGRTVLVEV